MVKVKAGNRDLLTALFLENCFLPYDDIPNACFEFRNGNVMESLNDSLLL